VTQRARVRAATAYLNGRPHEALMILDQAGLRAEWPTFIRAAHRRARQEYEGRMRARIRTRVRV